MTYQYFIGVPDRRIIRLSELRGYYRAEASAKARTKDISKLPAPIQMAVRQLRAHWPDAADNGQQADKQRAIYAFAQSSATITVDVSQATALQQSAAELAGEFEFIVLDCTSGGWLDAQRPRGESKGMSAFTSERGITTAVAKDDIALLLDRAWFVPERFFCWVPGASHFVQVINHERAFTIEFRSGPGRPLFRTSKTDLGALQKFLEGYFEGANMNTPEHAFKVMESAEEVLGSLPPRDPEGRWMPPPPVPASKF